MPYEDSLVEELSQGTVTFRLSGDVMPLKDYLENAKREFEEIKGRERALREQLSSLMQPYLQRFGEPDRNKLQRKIRWAVESQVWLKQKVEGCLLKSPAPIAKNSVELYQLTDYICSAVMASQNIPFEELPSETPQVPPFRWATIAPDEFTRVQNRIKVWSTLISLFGEVEVPPRRRYGSRPKGNNQEDIIERLQRMEALLNGLVEICKGCANGGSAKPRKRG